MLSLLAPFFGPSSKVDFESTPQVPRYIFRGLSNYLRYAVMYIVYSYIISLSVRKAFKITTGIVYGLFKRNHSFLLRLTHRHLHLSFNKQIFCLLKNLFQTYFYTLEFTYYVLYFLHFF